MGEKVLRRFGNNFPLFIDAKAPLSVQAHPNDALTKERHNCFGKNEMWYVVEAEENASLTLGFNSPMNRAAFERHQEKHP